ncbi:MAG: GNAT family N-acetyltransferase [Chloroflexota bacterium]|nr:GNAT family N-acetyltransferase [Chloroflexota bacterium]
MVLTANKSKTLITTYLEMVSEEDFAPAFIQAPDIEIVPMEMPDLGFYKFLYQSVGEEWAWRDRLQMSNSELRGILASPNTQVHVMYVGGSPAGYVELYRHEDGSVEVAYFGLRRSYMGRGLGKHLLSYGVARAWDMGAKRVWLHTCNLDGPHALSNYQKRGFRIYDVIEEPMPDLYA